VSSSGSGEQYRPQRPAPAEQHLGDRLAAFVDGELAGDSRDRVLAHLATCPQCKAAAAEQRRLKSVVAGSGLPAISAGLLARLQGLPGMDCSANPRNPDGPGGPAKPSGPSGDASGGRRRGPFDSDVLGSGRPGSDLSGSGLSRAGRREQFAFLGPAADLVPDLVPDLVADLVPAAAAGPTAALTAGDSRARGFRIHDSTSRGRRFAFAAAGAFSLAAIAIGSALPMEAAVDGGARPDDGPAVSPLSAGQVSDTRGVTPRGLLDMEEQRRIRHSATDAASATSVALTRQLLAPGGVPLGASDTGAPGASVVLR